MKSYPALEPRILHTRHWQREFWMEDCATITGFLSFSGYILYLPCRLSERNIAGDCIFVGCPITADSSGSWRKETKAFEMQSVRD